MPPHPTPRRTTAWIALLALITSMTTTACRSTSTGTEPVRVFGQWTLVAIEESTLGPGDDQNTAPTLTIAEDGTIHGFTGVNRFTGRVDPAALARGQWALGPLATTRMAGPAQQMQLESRYTAMLAGANRITTANGDLLLRQDDQPLLRFKAEQ